MRMTRMHRLGAFTFILLECLVSSGSAQDITVRLLDASSGHGMSGESVWLQFYRPDKTLQQIEHKTGRDGIAHFQLTEAAPEIYVAASGSRLWCAGHLTESPQNVFSHGASSPASCTPKDSVARIAPRPGEVILFARPMTLWQRLMRPLEWW